MSRWIVAIVLFAGVSGGVVGQKGTAGPGYYPMGYNGDIWTGEVTAADEGKRELTLTYTKGDKTQTFIAFVPDTGVGWMKDESGDKVIAIWSGDAKKNDKAPKNEPAHLNLSDLLGRRVTVYYVAREKKADEQKVKFNEVIRIKILPKK